MANTTIVQCNCCGGIYKQTQDDGTAYYHACPSQRVTVGAVVDPVSGKVITPAVIQKFQNRRDENISRLDAAGNAVIKSAGAGITPVFDPAVIAAAGFAGDNA